jgi:F420-dependent oxidoreductase-like protein
MRINLMIEGQEGVSWEQWVALARACEDHGLEGLFRSDHYAPIGGPPELGSLDAWATLAGLAAVTKRIRLGTMVSPVTFRHPSVLAKMAVTVDHISGGRVEVGMGAGWYEQDHARFGFPFPDNRTRLRMLAEQLEIVHRQWHGERFDFEGQHSTLKGALANPRPVQEPHPPLILGGSGGPVVARLAARWADEYNTTFPTLEQVRERRARLEAAFEREGRDPATLRFSVMTGCVVGADRADYLRRAARRAESQGIAAEELAGAMGDRWILGTVDEAAERLRELEGAGVERVMLQHLAHDDVEMVELIGRELVPALA